MLFRSCHQPRQRTKLVDRIEIGGCFDIRLAARQEGNARELVNRIQKIRKDNGFDLTDRILVKVSGARELENSISQFNTYICAEILADQLELVSEIPDGISIEVNEIPLKVFVTKTPN